MSGSWPGNLTSVTSRADCQHLVCLALKQELQEGTASPWFLLERLGFSIGFAFLMSDIY